MNTNHIKNVTLHTVVHDEDCNVRSYIHVSYDVKANGLTAIGKLKDHLNNDGEWRPGKKREGIITISEGLIRKRVVVILHWSLSSRADAEESLRLIPDEMLEVSE